MSVTDPSPSPAATYAPSTSEQAGMSQYSAASASSVGTGTGQVYIGTYNDILGNTGQGVIGGGRGQSHDFGPNRPNLSPVWASIQAAKDQFGTWTPKQINDFVAQGVMAGQLKPGDGWLEAGNLWNKLVDAAAVAGKQGQQVSPLDILRSYISNQQSAGNWVTSKDGLFQTNALTGVRRYIGPEFRTTSATSVNLTDPDTAKAVATSVFQQLLGRDPLPGELTAYSSALTQAEQANPTVITTTNQYDDQGNVIATTKQDQKGGYSADAQKFLAEQQAKAKPEFGATQAATTYENAFESAVFGAPR